FAINLPLGGVALALLLLLVPADQPEPGRRLDVVGGALATLGLGLMAVGLTGEGETSILRTIGFTGAGVLVLAGFLLWEARTRAPMMPLGLFRSLSFSGAQGLTF